MRHFSLLSCIAATFAASALFADAGNTLVTFSTVEDRYADGDLVADGEWYALCWAPEGKEFGGITSECEPVDAGDKIFLMAPLAAGGCCPPVVFQIDSKVAPTDGNYCVYLFDTRGVDKKPSKSVGGKPAIVSAAAATTATAKGMKATSASVTVTDKALAKKGGDDAWGESVVDESKIGQPEIKSFRIEGDKAVIKVSNMHSSVLYNVFTGATPDKVTGTTLSLPISAEKNDVEFYLDKDQGNFFKVGRQPIAK